MDELQEIARITPIIQLADGSIHTILKKDP